MTARIDRVAGTCDLGALFADEAPITPVLWEQAGKCRTHATYDRELVRALLSTPPLADSFVDLDPRELRATQPSILRAGVAYYLDDGYRRHGRTYADQYKPGNRYPIVYRRDEQKLILSGHHRAAAAVLQARPYRARIIEGPWGPEYGREADAVSLERLPYPPLAIDGTVLLTPSLLIGEEDVPHLPNTRCYSARTALEVICRAGNTARMPLDVGDDRVLDAITRLCWDFPGWAADQLHYAATGRIRS